MVCPAPVGRTMLRLLALSSGANRRSSSSSGHDVTLANSSRSIITAQSSASSPNTLPRREETGRARTHVKFVTPPSLPITCGAAGILEAGLRANNPPARPTKTQWKNEPHLVELERHERVDVAARHRAGRAKDVPLLVEVNEARELGRAHDVAELARALRRRRARRELRGAERARGGAARQTRSAESRRLSERGAPPAPAPPDAIRARFRRDPPWLSGRMTGLSKLGPCLTTENVGARSFRSSARSSLACASAARRSCVSHHAVPYLVGGGARVLDSDSSGGGTRDQATAALHTAITQCDIGALQEL